MAIRNLDFIKEVDEMWYVYNKQDSYECGYAVESREVAEAICDANDEMTCCYVGLSENYYEVDYIF